MATQYPIRSVIRQAIRAFSFLLALGITLPATAAQPQKLLVFTYKLSPSWVAAHGNDYVFVWGASGNSIKAFSDHSPHTILSKYFPYSRDPDAKHDISFWEKSHPGWIEYECDGKTPAKMYGGKNVSLDISNPEVVQWQAKTFSNLPSGVHEVALDNYQFNSHSHACGNAMKGKFIARYTGGKEDVTFANDIVHWLEQLSNLLHAHGIKVNINHTPDLSANGDDPSSPLVQRMVNATDGILDEGADRSLKSAPLNTTLAKLVKYVTAKGKQYYFVYRLNPFNDDSVQSAMASYLTMANSHTAVYMHPFDPNYGSEPPQFLGFDKPIGEPCGPATQHDGLIIRDYSQGMVVFALPGNSTQALSVANGYQDVHGNPSGSSLKIAGSQGRVLYRRDANGCEQK